MISPESTGPALRSRLYEEVTARHNGVFSPQPHPLIASSKVKMIQIFLRCILLHYHLGHHHRTQPVLLTLASSNRRKKRWVDELFRLGHGYVSLSPPHIISISMQVLRTLVRSLIVLWRLQLRHNMCCSKLTYSFDNKGIS